MKFSVSTSRLSPTFIQAWPAPQLFNKFLTKVKDFIILNIIFLVLKDTQYFKMEDLDERSWCLWKCFIKWYA